MAVTDEHVGSALGHGTSAGSARRRLSWLAVGAAVGVGLAFAYLRMSRTQPMNADGASQALQGWDLLHGNLLLRGWTLSDVSFYGNELFLFAAVEAVRGLNSGAVHVVVAILYAVLVLVVAALARGRATGWAAAARIAVAVAIMSVPAAGMGSWILLLSPDHTGTGVPVLLAWLVLDRGLTRADGSVREAPGWLPYAVGAILTWGQISDPLVLFVGALPLAVISGVRMLRRSPGTARARFVWRGIDARLLAAAIGSVLAARLVLAAMSAAGGMRVHGAPAEVVSPSSLWANLRLTGETLAINFGGYLPDRHGFLDTAMGAMRLLGLVAVAIAVGVAVVASARRRSAPGVRVNEVIVLGILVNLGAFAVSTLPADLTSARQIAVVLVLGAALAGRVLGPRLARVRVLPLVLAGLVVVYGGEFAVRATAPAVEPANATVAAWLESRHLSYGLGGFWNANDITVITGGRVQVAPITGGERMYGYSWESTMEWYDPRRHDARFLIVHEPTQPGRVSAALAQFGEPAERHVVGTLTILVYDHNLLTGLPVG